MTKTERLLNVYNLLICCKEVSFRELKRLFGFSEKTFLRDIKFLESIGVIKTRYGRKYRAFYPYDYSLRPMVKTENANRLKYMNKIRRLCILMDRLRNEPEQSNLSKTQLYKELFPYSSDRTRQRDYNELEAIGYLVTYVPAFYWEPSYWRYEIPSYL